MAEPWVKDLVEDSFGRPHIEPWHLYEYTTRKGEARLRYVVDGSYWGDYGRVSNHFTWHEVGPQGELGPMDGGYPDHSAWRLFEGEYCLRVRQGPRGREIVGLDVLRDGTQEEDE